MDAGLLSSLIWTCALGLAVGNYATSFIFRMPRGESPFTKHPYCGGCGTMLQPKDLLPAVSWLVLKGRCRYCEMIIPPVYFWTEIFCALAFMLGVWSYGWTEAYLLVAAGGTVAVTLWGLELRTGKLYYSVLLALAAVGLVYRTLLDATVFDALFGLVWGAGIPMALWRMRMDKDNMNGEKQRLTIPPSVALGATAGIWLATFGLLVFVVLWGFGAVAYRWVAARREGWPADLRTPAFCMALMLLVLSPQFIEGAQAWLVETARLWLARE